MSHPGNRADTKPSIYSGRAYQSDGRNPDGSSIGRMTGSDAPLTNTGLDGESCEQLDTPSVSVGDRARLACLRYAGRIPVMIGPTGQNQSIMTDHRRGCMRPVTRHTVPA